MMNFAPKNTKSPQIPAERKETTRSKRISISASTSAAYQITHDL
jgi:hypothetical protein